MNQKANGWSFCGPSRALFALIAVTTSLAVRLGAAQLVNAGTVDTTFVPAPSPAAVLQELKSFDTLGSVLMVAAHPDDENTQLIAYFARGRGYRMAYDSLTRGDGGQNELGPEFDAKLGVIRTQELLAARKIDGGRQFFSRAIDFGFSKTPEETLRFWNHDEVLGDVVRVIRTFQPDVIVTRFPIPPGSGGHGHHTASAMLATEAFKAAADPNAYPEQIKQGLQPWQAKRVVWNGSGQGLTGALFNTDIGGLDPVTGEDFAAIATRSRSQHKTQGLGNANFVFRQGTQTFTLLGGEPATKDLMDGVDTTWNRFGDPDCAAIGQLADKAIAAFDTNNLATNVPALLAIRAKLNPTVTGHETALSEPNPVLDDKRAQLDHILQECLGLTVETTAPEAEVVPGEEVIFHLSATLHASIPVKWVEAHVRNMPAGMASSIQDLKPGSAASANLALAVPMDVRLTQPYWLREQGTTGQYHVDDPKQIGTPENPPAFPVDYVFEVGGQQLVVHDEPIALTHDAKGDRRRRVDVIPPASLAFASEVSLFLPGSTRPVTVEVTAARPDTSGTLQLGVPADWKVTPESQKFQLAKAGDKARFNFNVTSPAKPGTGRVSASVDINGHRYSNERIEINYAHVPFILLQPKAEARLVNVDYAARGKNVGYLPGDGDDTVMALEQLGYKVTTLSGADLMPDKLKGFDAVVIGVRAFNSRTDLAPNLGNLFDYVQNGGTVVAQYNRPGNGAGRMGPYPLSIQGSQQNAPRNRVTDETAPVTFLQPENPALTTPNKIGPADFDGWYQERGAYFPDSWDRDHYTAILAMSDPGEAPLQGSLLVAQYGKGYYVYTGLAFFRQLPQGVPGAYRLFANLVSLGK